MNAKTIKVRVQNLQEHPDNPREITSNKYATLLQSVKEFPAMWEARPLVINSNNQVIGGNMRLRAFRELGIEEVPVIKVDWSEEEQREFMIKDNITHGQFDWDALANGWETESLVQWGIESWNFGTASAAFVQEYQSPIDPQADPTYEPKVTDGYVEVKFVCSNEHKQEIMAAVRKVMDADQVNTGVAFYKLIIR
jgi:hypothetical protein